MTNKEAIFIFTKDRPEALNRTLNSIQLTPYPKYIVDDSAIALNQDAVSNLSRYYSNCFYLGSEEFYHFIEKYNIEFPRFNFLLRSFGNTDWNLGYIRNFSLLYSKHLRLEKVLFTDDDIQVTNPKLIHELFQSVNKYQCVGANILGLVDDSILGHIATDIGIFNERMISGGFMAFDPNKICHFFLNNYNEDWIWLFLQLKDRNYLQTGEVFQDLSNPYINYKAKVIFQEFGEIALDGILDLYNSRSYNELTQLQFWERIIIERKEYLDLLISKSIIMKKMDYIEIIEWIKINSKDLNSEIFCKLFQNYFKNRSIFIELYNSL